MKITENSIIGDLVAQDYRTASVFKEYSVDFCCNGNRTIANACERKNINPATMIQQLQKATESNNDVTIDYNSWPIDLLADYIEKKHHRYVEQKILEIKPYLDKVARVHGERHPELHQIKQHFYDCADELTMHMKKEELIIFPFVRKLVKSQSTHEKPESPQFGSIQSPIEMMKHEHDTEGERFRKIEELSDHYNPPQDACNTYKVTFSLLKEFEEDLHLHIHLENNLLFPKAIEMERKFEYAGTN